MTHRDEFAFSFYWFSFIYLSLLCSTKPCKCVCKCTIIKVELIGDMVTFCTAQITATTIHTKPGIYVCVVSPAGRELMWHRALSLVLADLESLWRDRYCVFLGSNISPTTDLWAHVCNLDKRTEKHTHTKQTEELFMSLCFDLGSHQTGCFADPSSCLLRFPDCCLLLPSCLSKAIPLCICMCFCGCVNHASTQRSIQFLMGPPGLHSSSLLIFSCSPFHTPRGLDVSIGPAGANRERER